MPNVAAVLHAFPVNLVNGVVTPTASFIEALARRGHAQHATTGGWDERYYIDTSGLSVEESISLVKQVVAAQLREIPNTAANRPNRRS